MSLLRHPREWYQPVSTLPEAPTRRYGRLTTHSVETTFSFKALLMLNQMLGMPPPIPRPPPFLALLHSVPWIKHRTQGSRASLPFSRVITGTPFHLHGPSIPHSPSLPTSLSLSTPTPVLAPLGSSPQTSWLVLSLRTLTQGHVRSWYQTLFVLTLNERKSKLKSFGIWRPCHSPPHFLYRGTETWRETQ